MMDFNRDSFINGKLLLINKPVGWTSFQVVNKIDNHIERLSGWFDAENPKWNTYFSYTMKVDGQVGEWVISGHTLTTNVDGEEKTTYDLADVYIEDGKIGAFWIYSRAAVPSAE